MTKKFLILILALSSSLISASAGRVSSAIEEQSYEKVKKMLNRMAQLDQADRTSLLSEAEDKVDEAKGNVALLKSKWDLAKFAGGSLLALGGTAGAGLLGIFGYQQFRNASNSSEDRRAKLILAAAATSGVVALVGTYFAIKGYYCDTAYGHLVNAKKIAKLIKDAPVKAPAVVLEIQQQPVEVKPEANA